MLSAWTGSLGDLCGGKAGESVARVLSHESVHLEKLFPLPGIFLQSPICLSNSHVFFKYRLKSQLLYESLPMNHVKLIPPSSLILQHFILTFIIAFNRLNCNYIFTNPSLQETVNLSMVATRCVLYCELQSILSACHVATSPRYVY